MMVRPKLTGGRVEVKLKREGCYDEDFWSGYHYDNPGPGKNGYMPTLGLGAKVEVYRKDYMKLEGKWVWVNPYDKSDIDFTIDPKSVAELDREEMCLKQ